MKIKLSVLFIVLMSLSALPSFAENQAEPISKTSIIEKTNNTVYEVLILKPTKDSLTYEKELPMDLIPFSIRNDKYYPVGTAFKIGSNLFVSAAHVLNLGTESQFKDIYLRDSQGNVFELDKINKYSDHRDFVVFTLKKYSSEQALETNPKPKRNEPVLAVGNALGQGIIIRDGLYTSDTPEEENGEWNWVRFSAAASPGNSGGPLLDKEGKVIGVVLRKSENENLNYALPISEVLDAKENLAVSHRKTRYFLSNMDITKKETYHKEFKLPLSYQQLNQKLVESFNKFSKKLLHDMLAENKSDIFPNGKGSDILLQSNYSASFPHIIKRENDGNWDAFYPSETKKSELGNNGYLEYGGIIDTTFMYVETPNNIPIEKFYKDSKLFLDTVLKGIYIYRSVASEKIKITSMGKAQEDYIFTDSYKRKWIVRTWLMEFSDYKLLSFSLPIPGGFVSILMMGQTGFINNNILPDIEFYTDFIYLSYYGTLEQWDNYLKNKKFIPEPLKDISLSVDYNKNFKLKTNRIDITYSNEIMNITPKSDLSLKYSYFKDDGKVVWDIGGIIIGEDRNNSNIININRKPKPAEELSDSYQSKWNEVKEQKFPFNNTTYFNDGKTLIRTQIQPQKPKKDTDFLYTLSFILEGKIQEESMKDKLTSINQGIKIVEKY